MSKFYDREKYFSHIIDPAKKYDIIVCGSGPAGFSAAITASMQGAKVALVEARSQMGGNMTASFFMPVNWLFTDQKGSDRGGIQRLFIERIRSIDKNVSRSGRHSPVNLMDGGNLDCHPDYVRLMLYKWLDDVGVDYQLNSPVFDVIKTGDNVEGVVLFTKGGLVNLYGKIIIDATGDGDVAVKAGCDMTVGYEEDGNRHMPMMLAFMLGNTDVDKAFEYWYDSDEVIARKGLLKEARETGKYQLASWYTLDKTTLPGVLSINGGGSEDLNLDGANTAHLTVLEKLGTRLAVDFIRFAHDYKIPGLDECVLLRTSSFASIRDTKFLVGEYTLTMEDVIQRKTFEDTIALKYSNSDPVGFEIDSRIPDKKLPVPYRCLVPKKQIENLLVAGRNSSFSFMGFSYGRSMGDIMDLGQAAGVAAAVAIKDGVTPRNVSIPKLQRALRDMGVQI